MFDQLLKYFQKVKDRKIISLFDQDKKRAMNFSVLQEDLFLDFSKTNIDQPTLELLINLAKFRGISKARDAMFRGELINTSEGRAVLHTALRNLEGTPIYVNKLDVMPSILQTLEKMKVFSDRVRSGHFSGQGGAITDVLSLIHI